MKIVVTNNKGFSKEQKERLDNLGDVTYYDKTPSSAEEYLKRVEGADIICSGTAGLEEAYMHLKDVHVTVDFVSVAFLDLEVMKANNVTVSNSPGINRHAVSEWIMWMITNTQRNFDNYINLEETMRVGGTLPPILPGLADRHITILGHGNVAIQTARLAEAYDMGNR